MKDPVAHRAYQNKYEQTLNGKFVTYKYNAKHRGIEFSLSKEEFGKFWRKPCFYCGYKIRTVGLDRVNNTLGYRPENCVPCCQLCNMAKGRLTQVQFLALCSNVVRVHGLHFAAI